MNAIEIRGLKKTFHDFTLGSFDLTLPEGCILGLVGENGAGKSTTIKLIMNSIRPDSGSISVLGADSASPGFRAVKEDVGVVLDEACFPEALTAKNVGVVMSGTYKRWDAETYADYLGRFSLPADKKFKDYSRGMKMKLALAVALSHSPRLLILDEATSGLDPMVRDWMLDIFNDFTRDDRHSILISSHIVSDLEKICDYIAFLHRGKLLFCEEKDRLIDEYAMVRLPAEKFSALPRGSVRGFKESSYGVEALVERSALPSGMTAEKSSLEDIIVFLAKGDGEE